MAFCRSRLSVSGMVVLGNIDHVYLVTASWRRVASDVLSCEQGYYTILSGGRHRAELVFSGRLVCVAAYPGACGPAGNGTPPSCWPGDASPAPPAPSQALGAPPARHARRPDITLAFSA